MHFSEIDTPALLVDGAAAQRNIQRMADFFKGGPSLLRPHVKNHKTPEWAHRQLAAGGAQGVTCATLREAEAMAAGGLDDILIANEVVGRTKMPRLAQLAGEVSLALAVDDPEQIQALSAAAQAAGTIIGVLVDLNLGLDRCGVTPGPAALKLAQEAIQAPGLRFQGLMAYEAHAARLDPKAVRDQVCREALQQTMETKALLEAAGLPVEVVSSGSTKTYDVVGRYPGVTEVQAGMYLFGDVRYRRYGFDFEPALYVLTTVLSRPAADRAVADAGVKALGSTENPEVAQRKDCQVVRLNAEHALLDIDPDSDLKIGDLLQLIPGYGDPVANQFPEMFVLQGEEVADVWAITASSQSSTKDI